MLQPHLVMPYEFTLAEATDVLQAAGSNTSDYLKVVLRRRDVLAPQLNCLVNAFAESEVLDSASAKAAWVPGTLSGIPWVLKDCVDYSGKKTTGGMSASMIDHPVAQADAPVVRALREAGAVCVGKANLPDLHLGLSTSKSSFGPVKNPYNLRLPAIGSSGGVAAAVAARCAVFGIGVDTGEREYTRCSVGGWQLMQSVAVASTTRLGCWQRPVPWRVSPLCVQSAVTGPLATRKLHWVFPKPLSNTCSKLYVTVCWPLQVVACASPPASAACAASGPATSDTTQAACYTRASHATRPGRSHAPLRTYR
jgi:hypothetical protein